MSDSGGQTGGALAGGEAASQGRQAAFQAIDAEFARLEGAPFHDVARLQMAALTRIVRHAASETDFYRERLAPVVSDDKVDLGRWAEIPILTRRDVQENQATLRARTVPGGEGSVAELRTSGSTGTPLTFAVDAMVGVTSRAVAERLYAWHGIDVNARLLHIKAPDPQQPIVHWSIHGPEGEFHQSPVMRPRSEQLALLRELRPRYLNTFPTLARDLAIASLADGGERIALDAVLTVGEVVGDDVRDLCREAFGARVVDTYACRELGAIAIQCNASPHYHVYAPAVLVEVLDATDKPVGPGETGRAVVTSFYNYAMPLIRYALGDYLTLAERPCSCGRSLPTIAAIGGRQRNMLTLPGGDRLFLSGRVLHMVGRYVPLRQLRLVQHAPDLLELIYVPDGFGRALDQAGLEAYVRESIHPQMRITLSAVDDIPRAPSGKYEDVVGLEAG